MNFGKSTCKFYKDSFFRYLIDHQKTFWVIIDTILS